MPGLPLQQEQEAVAFLQKTASADGGSFYDHMTDIVMKVLNEQPSDPVNLLQTSLMVKKTANNSSSSSTQGLSLQAPPDTSNSAAISKIYGMPELPINPETGEPEEAEAANEYECENALNDAALMEACGVGLGRTDMYGVMVVCKQLGEDPKLGVATVRFFGKVLGVYADYYVFETTLKEQAEEEEEKLGPNDVPSEKGGAGANGYTYFVCNQLGGALSRLPLVKPSHIKAARQVKKFVSGKLETQVSAYPPFPGTEANFLRAQLARIAASTVLCPAGYFTANEEGGLDKAEDFTPPAPTDLGTTAAWAHRYPHLKKQGRTTVFMKEAAEGEEAPEPTEEESEQGPEPLSTLDKDAEVEGGEAWTPLFSSTNSGVKNQVAGVRSNLWQGAAAVASGAAFTNVYVGWGVKTERFLPLPPPPVAQEYDQVRCVTCKALVESNELPQKPEPVKEEEEPKEED
ncbi:hypothetical protein ABBQ32_006953 [Trebouxia sp. C0010 RCD-2024]